MEEGDTLPVESLIDDSDHDDNANTDCSKLSRKKTILLKEFPLNRHVSSAESQYIVLSQNDEVVDQASLNYRIEDFLSEDDNDEEDVEDDNNNEDADYDNDNKDTDDDQDDDDDDYGKLSRKKTILKKEFPLNRQGSSVDSQYVVLSQNDEVVDQATLDYTMDDFLSEDDMKDDDDDDNAHNDKDTDEVNKCTKNDELSNTEELIKDDDEDTDVDWDTEINDESEKKPNNGDNNKREDEEATNKVSPSSFKTTEAASSNNNARTDTPGLSKIESCYRDAKLINNIVPKDIDAIYDKLVERRSNPNRMDIVTATLLDEPDSTTSDDIFKDVKTVIKNVQDKSNEKLNEAYILSLLRLNEKKKNRVDVVTGQLLVSLQDTIQSRDSQDENTPKLKKFDTDSDDPLVKNDPIFQDMRVISKMFPDIDRNEIYAYLEAHHHKKDRIQVVIEELLKSGNSQGSLDETDYPNPTSNPLTNRSRGEFENLCDIFPDCDPNYIFEQLELNAKDTDRMNNLAAKMFESRDYPKLKDVLDKQSKYSIKRKIQNMEFNLKQFLAKIPDPKSMFELNDKAMSAGYKEHVLIQLKNDFAQFKDGYVKEVLERNNHSLIKCHRELNDELAALLGTGRRSKKMRVNPRMTMIPYPDNPDEFFFNELLYMNHELEIKMHLKKLEDEKKKKIEEAKSNGELYECSCCFDDEVLFEDMATCADGHLFCKECVKRSTEAAFGDAKTKFPCLTGTCEHDIPLSVLQSIVPPNLFSNIIRKLQEEELRLADIPDLVSCPFCSFATVMPDPNDKVFKCLNPECLKETCRFCQELNHVPLKCSEVEKKTETDMRTYIENKISEAMLRTCSNCKKRFFKDFGCNKMTCTCGTTMCYVCRAPNIDYDHFNDAGGCSNAEDANTLHVKEMEEAAVTAKRKYLEDHPEAANIEMKYDPQKLVDEMNQNVKRPRLEHGDFDDGYYDDEYPDDDEDDEYI
ncbi:hypothetical protein SNE40_009232 [Patella caerulea]|uniref:RING-type domain-containing protein n=1 Tax=Patella caerulea TaxID=87958 RepID=A0AAN8JP68_PATCE